MANWHPTRTTTRFLKGPDGSLLRGPDGVPITIVDQTTDGKPARFGAVLLLILLTLVCFPLGIIAAIIYGCTRKKPTHQMAVLR